MQLTSEELETLKAIDGKRKMSALFKLCTDEELHERIAVFEDMTEATGKHHLEETRIALMLMHNEMNERLWQAKYRNTPYGSRGGTAPLDR
jgi:CHASE3 domain sensor protein